MLLIETNLSTRIEILNEAQRDKPLKFRGIFAKLDHKTENGRVYSRELWEKCINSDSVQERLRRRQMLGELKHPEYRDIDIEKSAFIITKLWIEGGYVMGEAEITPYPTLGGILEVFVRAGCEIGISSRGEGSILEKAGDSHVDPKDFELITFDTTLNPAVTEAQPKVVKESIHKALETLKEKCSASQLRRVITVTEDSINLPETKMNNSNDNNDSFSKGLKIGKIVEKLKEKMQLNLQLVRENSNLKSNLDKSNLQNNNLKNLNEKLVAKAEELMTRYSSLKESQMSSDKNSKLFKEAKTEQAQVFKKEFSDLNEKYNRALVLISGLMESLDGHEQKTLNAESTVRAMKESIRELEQKETLTVRKLRMLQEKNREEGNELLNEKTELESEVSSISSENKNLERTTRQLKEQTQKLEQKLRSATKVNSELEARNGELTSLLKEARNAIRRQKADLVEKVQTTPSLRGDQEQHQRKEEIRNGVSNQNQLNSRTSKVTNQGNVSGINEEYDDSTSEIMNKLMFNT